MFALFVILICLAVCWFFRKDILAWYGAGVDPLATLEEKLVADEKAMIASFGKRVTPPAAPADTTVQKP
jgi:hypothetical protein